MTDTYFTEDDISFATLFKNGVCLTYDPFGAYGALHYAIELRNEYFRQNGVKRALIKSKAELSSGKLCPEFHYFSNGILIHNFDENEQIMLQRVLTMLKIRNLPIRKIYAVRQIYDYWKTFDYMRHLSERANLLYPYKDDIKIVPFPKREEFLSECFVNGNILLTASKDENVNPNIRGILALFADGRYYVAEEYGGAPRRYNDKNIKIFKKEHKDYVFLNEVFVPREYITALYKEAEKYDWYISSEDAKRKNELSEPELRQMNDYIKNLFNGRKCLSVTNLEDDSVTHFGADPDVDKYALFTDGTLIVGDSRQNVANTYWYDQMCRIYKDLELKIELVPDYYIPAIYAALPQYQRGAGEIYMEMLKEKAKKLKQSLGITHHEALDIAAKTEGWDDFQSVKIEDETHARHLISAERWRLKIAEGSLLREYELYLKNNK